MSKDLDSILAQFDETSPKLESLKEKTLKLVEDELKKNSIKFSTVSARTKTKESLKSKIERKKYEDPLKEITDLLGIRVVVYLEADIPKAKDALCEFFCIDKDNSIDKLEPTSVSEIGYRSLHLVCSLGPERAKLPEYKGLCEQRFEVQIRTILQDAWAVIDHEYNYKAQGALPPRLERKLMLASASLEQLDSIFSEVVAEADDYKAKIQHGGEEQAADPISALALKAIFLRETAAIGVDEKKVLTKTEKTDATATKELEAFGIKSIDDFEKLVGSGKSREIIADYISSRKYISLIQYCRTLMIIEDPARFFKSVDATTLTNVRRSSLEALKNHLDIQKLEQLIKEAGFDIVEEK